MAPHTDAYAGLCSQWPVRCVNVLDRTVVRIKIDGRSARKPLVARQANDVVMLAQMLFGIFGRRPSQDEAPV
jgi:hypothetical protein